jgi:hypothetical protein
MGKSSEFLDLLGRLEKKQAEFAAEGDGIISALQVLLGRSESLDEISVAELFRKCSAVAEEFGLLIPRTAQGFGQRLSSMRRIIELELGVNFIEMRGHERRRFVSLKER